MYKTYFLNLQTRLDIYGNYTEMYLKFLKNPLLNMLNLQKNDPKFKNFFNLIYIFYGYTSGHVDI